jgi:spermidine synthase
MMRYGICVARDCLMLRFLFPICLFLSALLLFSIQPMVAKALLPVYGGTPAVWTLCMLFFQIILLASYTYVWLLSLFNKPVIWRVTHVILGIVSLTALPLLFRPWVMGGQPEWAILYSLLIQLGVPLLLIGASAPLLQLAYSQTKNKGSSDPYFLYAASNLGSLISLLIYPWLIERYVGLTYQFYLWNIGYLVYLILLCLLVFGARYKPLEKEPITFKSWPWQEMMYWVFLSFIPCSLMLGVTLYITTDVAATPLFWVLPLALYLLSFILTFRQKPFISQNWLIRNVLFFLTFTVLGFILGVSQVRAWQFILFNLLSFFTLALLCHGQLFQRRPKPQLLTLFYFCLALGGVLAGLFNGILAPHWFNQVYEYPLAIVLSILALPKIKTNIREGWWLSPTVFLLMLIAYFLPPISWPYGCSSLQIMAIAAWIIILFCYKNKMHLFLSLLVLFVLIFSPILQKNNILLQQRDFYGVKQVVDKDNIHVLISQSTVHGLQDMNEKKPISGYRAYYGASKNVVEAMEHDFSSMKITLMGLGAGTMLCQFRAVDFVNVIEIDQQMIDLAKKPGLFSYMRDCLPKIDLIKNDGRLALGGEPNGSQDLIILDAFNSDAVPVHLLTLEAFTLYKKKMTSRGGILVNLSNRYLDLLPVINALGRSLDLMVLQVIHKGEPKLGQFDSAWAFLTANEDLAFQIMNHSNWRFLSDNKQFLWTDDYSNIIPLLRWR